MPTGTSVLERADAPIPDSNGGPASSPTGTPSEPRPRWSRRTVIVVLVLLTVIAATQVDRLVVRDDVERLDRATAEARRALDAGRADVRAARVEQSQIDDRASAARAELEQATARLTATGLDRAVLAATESDERALLEAVDDLRTNAQDDVDALTVELVDAKTCLEAGVGSLSTASAWGASTEPTATCRDLGSGDASSEAPSTR